MSPTGTTGKPEPKRKAGGTGKKGKTFMEDKSDLLSLVSGITASKAAVAQSKVDKLKPHVKPAPIPITGGNKTAPGGKGGKGTRAFGGVAAGTGREKKKSSAGDVKRAEKEKALADAKAAILEKRRAKKARKHEREAVAGGSSVAPPVKPAKKVGFA